MAAGGASKHESPEVTVLQLIASMETIAAEEDWHNVEDLSEKLRRALLQVPEEERREPLLAARRAVESVQALAIEARHRVSDKLSSIQRGKDATRAYVSTTGA